MDSELVVRQLLGEYKVREAHLKPLHRKALELLKRFSRYRIRHVPVRRTVAPTSWPTRRSTRKKKSKGPRVQAGEFGNNFLADFFYYS